MSNILIAMGPYTGHLNASFAIAKLLKQEGHHIIYVSPYDLYDEVLTQGFQFEQVLEDIFSGQEQQSYGPFSFLKDHIEGVKKLKRVRGEFLKGNVLDANKALNRILGSNFDRSGRKGVFY